LLNGTEDGLGAHAIFVIAQTEEERLGVVRLDVPIAHGGRPKNQIMRLDIPTQLKERKLGLTIVVRDEDPEMSLHIARMGKAGTMKPPSK
jgi:hypothetical protein